MAVLPSVAVDTIEELVVVFTLVGFWAPQGLSARHALWHGVFPFPQAFTHWFPYSWQRKKGMVCEKLPMSG